ncbi:hypothetical protein [Pseudomonas phage vB_PaeM_RP7]|nr:MAG: hypothetical protein [Pseudomonas phage RP4]WAB56752.1 hypothetical protein [Pseudomonas phage vB_PaeM_RP15]WAB57038.1 hypothetical protein [Pseudomonas phage vB_PaeM_RP6]WAB57053.1 hypothetical protein [Pseudomonas phage vB_PaeM_RP7]WAB57362.1 hypothetical protein [Pseudomonas phage vB_PaeM_RP8]WAB57548.1 hypothetical protein [Pseudomonas phage vB_PaeM_RP9]WAB57665.1 hypothetical protein [Pseudomonas phage vB_PaeM_RP10]WAB57781.1 hypothetical protein [Pseudomonas phage vB_PaeM_RP11]
MDLRDSDVGPTKLMCRGGDPASPGRVRVTNPLIS